MNESKRLAYLEVLMVSISDILREEPPQSWEFTRRKLVRALEVYMEIRSGGKDSVT